MKNPYLAPITVSAAFAATLGVLAPLAGADVVRLSQGFDDTLVFDPSNTSSGFRGDGNTIGGMWNFYSNTAGPLIINDGSDDNEAFTGPVFSGTQSAAAVRGGGSFTGRAAPGVAAGEDYELSFQLFRDTGTNPDSSFVFNATPAGATTFEARGFVGSDGSVTIRNGDNTAYVSTGLTVAEGVWTRVRLIVDRDTDRYTVSVTPLNGAESFAAVPQGLLADVTIGGVNFISQGTTGNRAYLDDIQLIEGDRVIPEPATLGLIAAAGLLLLRRR